MLTRDQILGAGDLAVESIDVPEWGGSVCIRVLTGAERDRFEQEIQSAKGKPIDNVRARLVALCVCDDQGLRLFTSADIAALGEKSATALDRIFTRSLSVNKLNSDDVETAKKN